MKPPSSPIFSLEHPVSTNPLNNLACWLIRDPTGFGCILAILTMIHQPWSKCTRKIRRSVLIITLIQRIQPPFNVLDSKSQLSTAVEKYVVIYVMISFKSTTLTTWKLGFPSLKRKSRSTLAQVDGMVLWAWHHKTRVQVVCLCQTFTIKATSDWTCSVFYLQRKKRRTPKSHTVATKRRERQPNNNSSIMKQRIELWLIRFPVVSIGRSHSKKWSSATTSPHSDPKCSVHWLTQAQPFS